MNLLNKFASVEIKADNRISDEDRAFCQLHQEAFDKSGPALQKIAEMIAAVVDEQQTILTANGDEFHNPYTSGNGFRVDNIHDMIKTRNTTFISELVSYFRRKYNVELDAAKIVDHLIPPKPESPSLPWGGYKNMTDAEIAAYEEKLHAYKVEQEAYDQKINTLPLRYEQVVDEIFVQLGGFSFQEQAMNEFRERVWACCHHHYYNQPETEEFEVKNKTLKLTGYWCSCDDGWSWGPEWKLSDDLKTLAEALAHYECGRIKEGRLWYPELCEYMTKENVFTCHHKYVDSIKFFKNGRVDIKFRNASYAQEFMERYLRRRAA